jgi:hypothetical protein
MEGRRTANGKMDGGLWTADGQRDGRRRDGRWAGSAWWGIQDGGRDLQAEGAATRRARQVAPGRRGRRTRRPA